MRALFSTLRFRVTLLYVLIFGVTLLIFCTVLYIVYQRNQSADFDKLLYNRAWSVARNIAINQWGELDINQNLITESGKLLPFQLGNEYMEVRTPDGKSLARLNLGTYSFPLDSQLLSQLQEGHYVYSTIFAPKGGRPFWGEGNLRLLSVPLSARGHPQILLQLGVSTHAHDQSLARLRTFLFFVGVPITIILAGIGGWWLAGHAFQPINRIVSAAQQLGVERLEERLPVPEAEDELKRLSLTLNEMLGRLERAFKSQQRFVADASHELKTPLTILQGELGVLSQQPRTVAEYQTFLTSASEELQRLSQIVQNLLLLAQADLNKQLELRTQVRLDEMVLEVMERLQSFAKSVQVKLAIMIGNTKAFEATASNLQTGTEKSLEETLSVCGEADLLASLFFNLVHNAVKHSAAGQTVEIKIFSTKDGPYVSVRDFGTGIRPEDLPHIFERFHRAENPSRRNVAGTGLGLAIAKWIADAHHAKISVESKPAEGSLFTVSFPPLAS